jgi:Flp pilus assembly pilin Flp
MKNALRRFHGNDEGASATEYIIILVLVAVGLILAWQNFGQAIKEKLNMSRNQINTNLTTPTN